MDFAPTQDPTKSAAADRSKSKAGRNRPKSKAGANKSLPDIEMSRVSDASTIALGDPEAEATQTEDARLAVLAAKATQEAYDELLVEISAEKKQGKRMRARMQRLEKEVSTSEAKACAMAATVAEVSHLLIYQSLACFTDPLTIIDMLLRGTNG